MQPNKNLTDDTVDNMSGQGMPSGPGVTNSTTVVQSLGPQEPIQPVAQPTITTNSPSSPPQSIPLDQSNTVSSTGSTFSNGGVVSGQIQAIPMPGDPKPGSRKKFKLILISLITGVILLGGLGVIITSIINVPEGTSGNSINNADKPEGNTSVSSKEQASDNKSQQSVTPVESPADAERKADINAIHAQAEAHFSQTGAYPTLAELTNASYRKANLNGLSEATLTDPAGSELISSSATASRYGYVAPKTASCPSGRVSVCNQYMLTAILSNGQSYTKQSLQ